MYLKQIKKMHEHFGIDKNSLNFTQGEKKFRYLGMKEEVEEFLEAKTRTDELDALVDIATFLFTTVERMGFSDVFEEAFTRVFESNMTKEMGVLEKRGDFKFNLKKGKDFVPAKLDDLVYNFEDDNNE